MEPRWYHEKCKEWHKGYPPLNCPNILKIIEELNKVKCHWCDGKGISISAYVIGAFDGQGYPYTHNCIYCDGNGYNPICSKINKGCGCYEPNNKRIERTGNGETN